MTDLSTILRLAGLTETVERVDFIMPNEERLAELERTLNAMEPEGVAVQFKSGVVSRLKGAIVLSGREADVMRAKSEVLAMRADFPGLGIDEENILLMLESLADGRRDGLGDDL